MPENAPLVVSQPGTTVHDATFWQPLALGHRQQQTFADAQWGDVTTYAGRAKVGAPPWSDPSSSSYRQAAIAVLRATARKPVAPASSSPLVWNELAKPEGTLTQQLHVYVTLNGALNDAAVSVWAAKRRYQAPRPISMIRYLAFNNQLPIVAGVSRRVGGKTEVYSQGRWILGANWTPPLPTPASPGWVSEGSAFDFAASTVLAGLEHRSVGALATKLAAAGVAQGIETPADDQAGRTVGVEVGRLALAKS
jgi:hypothetical protein